MAPEESPRSREMKNIYGMSETLPSNDVLGPVTTVAMFFDQKASHPQSEIFEKSHLGRYSIDIFHLAGSGGLLRCHSILEIS